jgi:hypothetical protein
LNNGQFYLPTHEHLCKQWLDSLFETNSLDSLAKRCVFESRIKAGMRIAICHRHFEPKDITVGVERRKLLFNAVPRPWSGEAESDSACASSSAVEKVGFCFTPLGLCGRKPKSQSVENSL